MKTHKHPDLSFCKDSLTAHVSSLIPLMDKMNYSEIKEKFEEILDSVDVKASVETRKTWKMRIAEKGKTKFSIMKMITDLYLAGCNLSVSKKI